MTREQEIKTLQSLKGDTYFAQYFSEADIDRMCENINCDFAIELGCTFGRKPKSELDSLRVGLTALVKAMCEDDLLDPESATYKQLAALVGRKDIIRAKMALGCELDKVEIKWLCQKAGIEL